MNKLYKYDKKMRSVCVGLYCDIFTKPPFNYGWLEQEKIERYFFHLEQTPNFLGFTYIKDDEIVGLCLGIINDYFHTNKYYIKELAVKSGFQNEGIGTEMLGQIEKYLIGAGVNVMDLLTSNDERLINYYKKNGFKTSETSVYMLKSFRLKY